MSGCAVAPDGSLLDASEIEFFNDVDDDVPISHPAPQCRLAAAASTSSIASTVNTLDSFFSSRSPAAKVAGVCRTACASSPSAWIIDPDNALTAKAGQKCKANGPGTGHRVAWKHCVNWDTDNGEPDEVEAKATNSSDEDASDGEDEENVAAAQASYDELKAMGDNDRQVWIPVCLIQRSWHTFATLLPGNAEVIENWPHSGCSNHFSSWW